MGASLSEGHDPFCAIISNCSNHEFPERLCHRMTLERGGERREVRCGGGGD